MTLRAIQELAKLDVTADRIEFIRDKEGIQLFRVFSTQGSSILKYFEHEADRREIVNYGILQSLGISTLTIYGVTDRAILMEDVSTSLSLRLGTKEDLDDPVVMSAVATWYRELHDKGKDFLMQTSLDLYDETDEFTLNQLHALAFRSGTTTNPIWQKLEVNYPRLRRTLNGMDRTLCYNDFYYTNLIVAKDKSMAFMFDYNLLGKGLAYTDVANATWHSSGEAKAAFFKTYGMVDDSQQLLHELITPLISLMFAYRRSQLPDWAKEDLKELTHQTMEHRLEKVLERIG